MLGCWSFKENRVWISETTRRAFDLLFSVAVRNAFCRAAALGVLLWKAQRLAGR